MPSLSITNDAGRPLIAFVGTLWSAESCGGPWTGITNADSPLAIETNAARRFYRAAGHGTNSFFSGQSVVALSLTGPLQAFFEKAYAGLPDGIFPPLREKPWFDATLRIPGHTVPVSLRVRGNSSLQECPFPKLKFKVSREPREGTPFADARELKIGTHCAEGGTGPIGRLREQTATFREALAYETMDLLDFLSPRVRRARVTYRDTTPATNSSSVVGWEINRQALIFEDSELIATRLGGRVLADAELPALHATDFDLQLAVDLQFLHALLGNWDYSLGWDSRGVWNTEVIELTTGTKTNLIPVAGDFDLASFVTGYVRRMAPHNYHPELGDVEREALYATEQIQGRVPPANFAAAIRRFLPKRPFLETHIASATLDDTGRANALRHILAFYAALDTATSHTGIEAR